MKESYFRRLSGQAAGTPGLGSAVPRHSAKSMGRDHSALEENEAVSRSEAAAVWTAGQRAKGRGQS